MMIAPPSAHRAFADDAVLVGSTVPGYAPGMVVSSSDHLSVPEGASVTLLFQSGEILRLGGPFDGTLQPRQGPAPDTSAARLADMFRVQGVDASVIGGTRSTGSRDSDVTIDDVQVDPTRSGTYCVGPSTSVWIGRPDNDHRAITLRRRGSARTLGWPQDAVRTEWPADVAIDDSSQFEIGIDGAARATVTFRSMPADALRGPARVAKGILLGCQIQFDPALRRLGLSMVRPELWMTTDRGRRPAYRNGDKVILTVTASVDGYLYCVASGKDGNAIPIFPAGAVDGAELRGSTPITVPGLRQPAGLTAAADIRRIRCWLADRNISPELPHALIGGPPRRIPEQLAGELDGLFARIGGTRIETEALDIGME
jgi:hypothetical protein